MHTPLKTGDRVHNAAHGAGTVTGFTYPEGHGEEPVIDWDYAREDTPESIPRFRLQRILGVGEDGAMRVGKT